MLAALAAPPGRANAADRVAFSFEGKRIAFTTVVDRGAGEAVSIDDPGLRQLFNAVGASVTYQQGGRYVLVTTAEPVVISFAVGDTRYDVGPVSQTAAIAPFVQGGHAYVPMTELLRGLDLAPVPSGAATILQPQLSAIDLQSDAGGTKLVAHGGVPLNARIVSQSDDRLDVQFDGVGSSLPQSHTVDSGAVREVDVRTAGTPEHPITNVTLLLAAGATHSGIGTDDQRDVTIAFNGADGGRPIDAGQPEVAQQSPAQPSSGATAPASPAAAQTARVTSVTYAPNGNGGTVNVAVDGNATYEWHRLRPPDNRWWIDIRSARLNAPVDAPGGGPVTGVRAHQENADTVRVALSLQDFDSVTVTPSGTGVTIAVDNAVADESAARSGSGTIGDQAVAQAVPNASPGWKFSPPAQSTYAAPNPRLIVIDPGHGGSDTGAMRGDLIEKTLNLDMSKRLRDILVSRGWEVVMTREDDRDVYQPNDSAADELQARDDIANSRGARLIVSVHSNSYINSGPHGATVYFYKPSDYALAQDVDRRIASELGIYNNGVVKGKYYIINHAKMPGTLVETAFLSNPDDRELLQSPEWRQKMAQAIADGIQDYAGDAPAAQSASTY